MKDRDWKLGHRYEQYCTHISRLPDKISHRKPKIWKFMWNVLILKTVWANRQAYSILNLQNRILQKLCVWFLRLSFKRHCDFSLFLSWTSHSGRSLLPCCEDTQAILWRRPHWEQPKPPAIRHMNKTSSI